MIDWSETQATLTNLTLGASDAAIVETAQHADKIGIDCPFGWPDAFLAFITAHAAGHPFDRSDGEGMARRRQLAYRATDRAVHDVTGRWPLSVSTDRLGLTAMRCAALLDSFAESNIPVDRTGSGRVVEVYPAAALRCWGYSPEGYKTDVGKRMSLVTDILKAAPWFVPGEYEPLMRSSHDALDAVLAALVARASETGSGTVPPPDRVEQAAREGWISLPTVGLGKLILES